MSKKKSNAILITIILCLVVIISMTIVAAGEEIETQPSGSASESVSTGGAGASDPTQATDSTGATESTSASIPESQPTEPSTAPTEPSTAPTEPEDPTMKVSGELLRVLKRLEGFEPYAYWDYKQWSIGYGSKCPEGYETYYQKNPISEEYAEELLRKELVFFEGKINEFIVRNNLKLTQHQYDALVSFTYNTGANWTTGTTGNFNSAVISGDTGSHFIYGMMLWSTAGGRHILVHRRIVEMNIYANGIYAVDALDTKEDPDRYRIAFMDGNGGVVKYDEHGFDTENPIAPKTQFKSNPTGPDENGKIVTYVLDGWYTEREGGRKIELMDESVPMGTVLYAHWKTPTGHPVVIPRQQTGIKVKVTLTGTNVNVRVGPDTYFAAVGQATVGDELEIVEVTSRGGLLWGRFNGDNWIALKYTNYDAVLKEMLPKWAMVTGTTLNVRKDAGTDYDIIAGAQKKQGDLVKITEWKSDGTMMWGKIEEGWIALPYVTFEGFISPDDKVAAVEVIKNPDKLSYLHKKENLDVTGGQLKVTYTGGQSITVDLTPAMVTGFDNTKVGNNTLTITYEGVSTKLNVLIIKAKVIFKMEDGTVISEKEYEVGQTIEIPTAPTKPGEYVFAGWTPNVATVCDGNATYVAKFRLASETVSGDLNDDNKINSLDGLMLLRYLNGWDVNIASPASMDVNKDGKVNSLDGLILLRYLNGWDVTLG